MNPNPTRNSNPTSKKFTSAATLHSSYDAAATSPRPPIGTNYEVAMRYRSAVSKIIAATPDCYDITVTSRCDIVVTLLRPPPLLRFMMLQRHHGAVLQRGCQNNRCNPDCYELRYRNDIAATPTVTMWRWDIVVTSTYQELLTLIIQETFLRCH